MRKYLFLAVMMAVVTPLFGQEEGYSKDGTSYTTTLKHTPYSSENKQTVYVQSNTPKQVTYVQPEPKLEVDFDLSGCLAGTRIYYNDDICTQRIPEGGINLDVTFGARMKTIMVGGGVGVHTDFVKDQLKDNMSGIIYKMPLKGYEVRLPIYAKARFYIPTSTVFPFFESSIGGYVRIKDQLEVDCSDIPEKGYTEVYKSARKGGVYFQLGGGIEYKNFTAALGYRYYGNSLFSENSYAYLSIGISLRK